MKTSSMLRAVATVALSSVAASAATAQAAVKPSAAVGAPAAWAALPTGTYKLDIQLTERAMPATVIVRDSSGVPAATFQPEGDQEAHPVRVTIKGAELFLNAEAPKGPFELVMLRQAQDSISGRWKYAGEEGKLTGTTQK